MTIKKSLPLKVLAFLLAVLALAGCATLGCYQIMEIDMLWGSEPATSTHQIHQMQAEEFSSIYHLLSLRSDRNRTAYQDAQLEELEERYAAENTNLRWQIRSTDDELLYSNIDGELPASAYEGYWHYFNMPDTVNVIHAFEEWQAYAEGVYTIEETPAQIRSENWPSLLADAVELWQSGDRTADPDAVYLGLDGTTSMLIIEDYDGMVIYAPTIRSVLEINNHGYQYDLDDGWIRSTSSQEFRVIMWLDSQLAADDAYKDAVLLAQQMYSIRVLLLVITVVLALVWLLTTIYLCICSGWKKGYDEVRLCWFHRIPGDLLLVAYILLAALLISFIVDQSYYLWYQNAIPLWGQLTIAGLCGVAAAILLTSFLVTFVARCKGGVILRNMIVVRILLGFVRVVTAAVRSLPLIWKLALTGCIYLFFSLILIATTYNYYSRPFWLFVWIILSLLLFCYLGWWAMHWKKIRRGTKEIISGNTDYHIDTTKMPPDLKGHASELNNLSEAISAAVDDRMRSEHFKAELITNVSHDLKTPLTSIINYVDLLKKEEIDNPKVAEYIEVLDRKSQRLKKLTEDLVEASKASTGNLTVVKERLDLVQLVDQALAEYQEKLESQRLSIVRTLPAEPVWVRADGRHLWRVIDNLLSNCAKYALEGTRVYAEVERYFDCAALSIKNISRDALNVDPDTLMERFVRGDESRTTEGSGLGLSIAQSLTDLQEGQFQISIDGDLFKATIRLPLADSP